MITPSLVANLVDHLPFTYFLDLSILVKIKTNQRSKLPVETKIPLLTIPCSCNNRAEKKV